MVEFAIVFPVQLFLTLAILQTAHNYIGKLVINHAAFNAARAALVRPDNVSVSDWERDQVHPAAAMTLAPITGPSEGPSVTATVTIPGWDISNRNELARSGTAELKTRVRVFETNDSSGRAQVRVDVEHDFQMLFVPDASLLDIWNKYTGAGIPLSSAYQSPHLTLIESCTLPRTWDISAPSF